MKRWLHEPLLHFALLGALLFAVHALVARRAGDDEIVVERGRIEHLAAQFERARQRAPTAEELDGLIAEHVREEVLFREGLALGLDRDDPIIRNRVRQKVEFVAQGVGSIAAPTEADLRAWFDAHRDDYRAEPRFAFEQVFVDPQVHRTDLDARLDEVGRALAQGGGVAASLSDPTLLPRELDTAAASDVARTFGDEFAAFAGRQPVGTWGGPVASPFGRHFVRVRTRDEGFMPAFDAVRTDVERDWSYEQTRAGSEAFYRALRDRYRVTIERSPTPLGDGQRDAGLGR